MFNGLNEKIVALINDAQPLIITLLALSIFVSGAVMMFGDTGVRWAKRTLIGAIIGAVLSGGALVYARSFKKIVNVSAVFSSATETKFAVIDTLQIIFM
ncbi:hypothetical protein M6K113_2514 [Staphylococcus aureus]|uniref:hypothetical protein n=1 Tax=Staphylococcus aureus TaxID=1280 RepID=UPI000E3C70D1|nr:hypothetical protein [Staphylococcus aureus]GBZ12216.1 hypothetical protein M6K113_2514 [Staphylococcus aureus]